MIAADLLIPTQLAISPPRFLDLDLELAVAGRHQGTMQSETEFYHEHFLKIRNTSTSINCNDVLNKSNRRKSISRVL